MLVYIHLGNYCAGVTTNERLGGGELSESLLEIARKPARSRCFLFCCGNEMVGQSELMRKNRVTREIIEPELGDSALFRPIENTNN